MVKKIGFLVIGDEILSGRTVDKNINALATTLDDNGYQLAEVRIIADNKDTIISAVQHAGKNFDYVFTSGGIGGTHDDITFACVAQATNRPLICNQEAYDALDGYYKNKGLEWTQTRKNMTMMPENCQLLQNPISLAPGAVVDNIFVCAGIPKIFKAMLDDALCCYMRGGIPLYKNSVYLAGVGEGTIGDKIASFAKKYADVSIGSYPHFDRAGFSTEIVVRSRSKQSLDACFAEIQAYLVDFL